MTENELISLKLENPKLIERPIIENENSAVIGRPIEKLIDFLKKKSLEASMNLIKKDLKNLGISHDNFLSETYIVKKDMVNKTVKFLKEKISAIRWILTG